jgi:hypothetical protein
VLNVPRRPKAPEDRRVKVGHTLAPATIKLLTLICDHSGYDSESRLLDDLIAREAKRLHIKPPAK